MHTKLLIRSFPGLGLLAFCLFFLFCPLSGVMASQLSVRGSEPVGPALPVAQEGRSLISGAPAAGGGGKGPLYAENTSAPNVKDVVQYETLVVAKKNKLMLALYNTLSGPVDEESLVAMAQHCYAEVGGNLYEKVFMNWYLPGQAKGSKPWAVSNFTKDMEMVEILDEELAKKFPSAKRWQQPGHDPLVP